MQERLKTIYRELLKTYGKQGWWPLTPPGALETRNHSGKPINEKHRFEIIVGAILTQNTSWKNVEKAIFELNKEKLIDIKKISKVSRPKLAKLIRSSGYYNQKAERLKVFARHILKYYNGSIASFFNKSLSDLRKELLKIKGIGPETADSILLYAAEKPSFVVDAYTKRVFSRLNLLNESSYDEIQRFFMQNLPKDVGLFKEYHALIVEHAKQHCRKRPVCEGCILRAKCKFQSNFNSSNKY